MPLFRRVPKRGFTNLFKKNYSVLNIRDLNQFGEKTTVTPELLLKHRVIRKIRDGLRILGQGELDKKLNVQAHHFSKAARRKIESAGGKVEVID